MTEIDPRDYLCSYDKRSTYFNEIWLDEPEEETPKPRDGCACDNCFYGKDKLALEIIRLREALIPLKERFK